MGIDDSDGWDWEWFRYGSTVILKENFERLTPREFNALMKVHVYVNDPKSKKRNKLHFIDEVL